MLEVSVYSYLYQSICPLIYLHTYLQSWTNICRRFHVLEKFLFTTSEMELDYYKQKENVRVVSRTAKRLKTSLHKICENMGPHRPIFPRIRTDDSVPTRENSGQ